MRIKQLLIACTILAFSVTLPSAASSADEKNQFLLRDAAAFGMSADEVIKAEEEKNQVDAEHWTQGEEGIWNGLMLEDPVKVSDYEANLVYMFCDDGLQIDMYDFKNDVSEEMYNVLTKALSQVYGEAVPVSGSDMAEKLNLIFGKTIDESAVSESHMWEQDNVLIYQCYYMDDQSSFAILYLNPDFDYESAVKDAETEVNATGL